MPCRPSHRAAHSAVADFPRVGDPRERQPDGSHNVVKNLILKVIDHHFHCILLDTDPPTHTVGGDSTRG